MWGSPQPTLSPSPVLLSGQLIFPDLVEGLVLMNIDPNGKGWIDWAATKVSVVPLAGGGGGEGWHSPWPPSWPTALWPDQHFT